MKFENPEMEVVEFDDVDIICNSGAYASGSDMGCGDLEDCENFDPNDPFDPFGNIR